MDHNNNNNNIVHSPFYRVDNIVIHIPVETVILCVVDRGRDRERETEPSSGVEKGPLHN